MLLMQANLGWAYMQQGNFIAAEAVYHKAQIIDPDLNKACNLAHCLIKQSRDGEARDILEHVLRGPSSQESEDAKSKARAEEILHELGVSSSCHPVMESPSTQSSLRLEDAFMEGLDRLLKEWNTTAPYKVRRLPVFEEISSLRDQLAC